MLISDFPLTVQLAPMEYAELLVGKIINRLGAVEQWTIHAISSLEATRWQQEIHTWEAAGRQGPPPKSDHHAIPERQKEKNATIMRIARKIRPKDDDRLKRLSDALSMIMALRDTRDLYAHGDIIIWPSGPGPSFEVHVKNRRETAKAEKRILPRPSTLKRLRALRHSFSFPTTFDNLAKVAGKCETLLKTLELIEQEFKLTPDDGGQPPN